MKGYDVIIAGKLSTIRVFYFAVSAADALAQAEQDYIGWDVQAVVSHVMIEV
jgi:hypothetical protein